MAHRANHVIVRDSAEPALQEDVLHRHLRALAPSLVGASAE
jgi:hypothetical protein